MIRRILISSRPTLAQVCFLSTQISPMSPHIPLISKGGFEKIPTAAEVTATGGVWSQTSGKRDKIVELRGALEGDQKTLDDAATEHETLDLYLADGMIEVAKAAEYNNNLLRNNLIQDFVNWLDNISEDDWPKDLAQVQYDNFLTEIISKIDSIFSDLPKEQYLKLIRDFTVAPVDENDFSTFQEEAEEGETIKAFQACIIRYRLHLIRTAAEHLKEHWGNLVKITDGDMDRAAVKGESSDQMSPSLPLDDVRSVLLEHASGDSSTRLDAIWNLVDRDKDGLLDESEMKEVVYLATIPNGKGLLEFFEETLSARPAWQPLDYEENEEESPKKIILERLVSSERSCSNKTSEKEIYSSSEGAF